MTLNFSGFQVLWELWPPTASEEQALKHVRKLEGHFFIPFEAGLGQLEQP